MNIEERFEPQFENFLSCIEEAGWQSHIIIVGSWAEFLYMHGRILDGFVPDMFTHDLDVMMSRRPGHVDKNVVATAEKYGFKYDPNRHSGYSRFVGNDFFTVEFLTQQRGDGQKLLRDRKSGITPQQLPHMWMLENTVEVQYKEHRTYAPSPEAYFAHKVVINSDRGPKAVKDRSSIYRLEPFIDKEKLDHIIKQFSKKELARYNEFEDQYLNRHYRETILHVRDQKGNEWYANGDEITRLIIQEIPFEVIRKIIP